MNEIEKERYRVYRERCKEKIRLLQEDNLMFSLRAIKDIEHILPCYREGIVRHVLSECLNDLVKVRDSSGHGDSSEDNVVAFK